MPFKSDQQRKWAHTAAGQQALGGATKVAEWDASSKGLRLPRYAPKRVKGFSPKQPKLIKGK